MLLKKKYRYASTLRAPLLILILLLIPFYGNAMSNGILRGIRLCVTTIVPSVFPFMILSSMMIGYSVFENIRSLSMPFERLFHINKNGLTAFLCGTFCGFPLGAKCAREAYECGYLTKDECERLICFSSNASPAFLICGIGKLRSGTVEGIYLYLVMILSAIAVGVLLGRKRTPHHAQAFSKKNSFSFTDAVEHAGLATLNVCSYLLLFSSLIGILEVLFPKNAWMSSFILPWLEIGSATSFLSKAKIPSLFSRSLTAFSISFGGLSVHLQSAGLLRGTDISMKKYYISKTLQGIISFTIVFLIGLAFNPPF